MPDVTLREVLPGDLPAFFAHQLDPEAVRMAAFTAEDPSDQDAFMARWAKIMADESMVKRTVLHDGDVAGHIVRFERSGDPEITYWIDRALWGRGIATAALTQFLAEVRERPLYARAAKDNLASLRVLEKCGFVVSGTDRGFASARGEEIEEAIFELRTLASLSLSP